MTDRTPEETAKLKAAIWAFVALLLGGLANIVLAERSGTAKTAAWWITIAMILLLAGCIGKAINGRWDGVLVDARNRVSLSRLQMFAWTTLILSAIITAGASNLAVESGADALAISIPDELLAAMGIAATSMAATPALLSLKGRNAQGEIRAASNSIVDLASWLDMFRGDETADENTPDLSKIQQFLITIALIAIYGVSIGNIFERLPAGQLFPGFPPLDPKFIWLLGISHAGYLTYKAASQPSARPGAHRAAPETTAPAPAPTPVPAPVPPPTQ